MRTGGHLRLPTGGHLNAASDQLALTGSWHTGTSGTHELLTHVLVSTDQHLRERAQSNHWLRE